MIKNSLYSEERTSEEDRNFSDKYSVTGESEWSRGSTVPFEDDAVLSERHYNIGKVGYGSDPSQFSREIPRGEDHRGKGPKGYKRTDSRILEDVSDALYRCYEVDASQIEVSVVEGCVHLDGSVDSRLSKKIAEMTVDQIPGVMDVKNDLKIIKPTPQPLIRNETGLS